MELISVPQALEKSEHSVFGKDFTDLKKIWSKLDWLRNYSVCACESFTLFYSAVCLDIVRL